MNTSTKDKFKTLSQEDKKIAFNALVEQQAITYDHLMDVAHKEAGDRSAADKIITAMINNQTSTQSANSKRQKKTTTDPYVTPKTANQTSAYHPRNSSVKKIFSKPIKSISYKKPMTIATTTTATATTTTTLLKRPGPPKTTPPTITNPVSPKNHSRNHGFTTMVTDPRRNLQRPIGSLHKLNPLPHYVSQTNES